MHRNPIADDRDDHQQPASSGAQAAHPRQQSPLDSIRHSELVARTVLLDSAPSELFKKEGVRAGGVQDPMDQALRLLLRRQKAARTPKLLPRESGCKPNWAAYDLSPHGSR